MATKWSIFARTFHSHALGNMLWRRYVNRGEKGGTLRGEYFTLMHFSRETYVCISYGANYCLVFFDISRAILVIIRIRVHEKRYLIAKIAMTHKLHSVCVYIYVYI